MNFIGIDFSINYPALTILKHDKIEYFSFLRPEDYQKLTRHQKEILNILSNIPTFKNTILNNKIIKTDNYQTNELNKVIDAIKLTDILYGIISTYDNYEIGIEGFSYGSSGNVLIDIASYQYILRYKLYTNNHNFQVFSPKTIKKLAGKGNFNKQQMVNSYINNTVECELLDKCEIRQTIYNNQELFLKTKANIKIWEDLVDSYFVAKYIQVQNKLNNLKFKI